MEPVDRSTIWPYDEHGEPREFFYARYAHPTGAAAEARLGELEGGDALLYASGTGAETAVLLAFARPGTTIALAEGAYFGTSVLLRDLEPWGVKFVEYDQTGPPPEADIVWVESPANPTLTVPRLGGAPRPSGADRLRRDRLDAGLPASARRGRRRRRPLGDQVPDRQPRRAARRDGHARPGAETARCACSATGPAALPRLTRRRRCSTASTRSSGGCAASPRRRPTSQAAWRRTRRSTASATRASRA